MRIREAIQAKAVELLGGSESVAYSIPDIAEQVYQDIIQQLKRQFGIKKFAEIYMCDEEVVLELIHNAELPIFLETQIAILNGE